jgi:hypothetical protein
MSKHNGMAPITVQLNDVIKICMTSAGNSPLCCYFRLHSVLYKLHVFVKCFIQICRYSVGWRHCSLKCVYRHHKRRGNDIV